MAEFRRDKQEPAEWDFALGYGVVARYEAPLTKRIAYNGSGQEEYIGNAAPGTATSAGTWQIKKLTYDSNGVATIVWADGDSNYDNIWDNRASLSYS